MVHRHMQQYEVEYLQFAFRWMNNLLMRELPLRCTIRLWDTYQLHALCFLLTTDGYCLKCQFPSISTAQRKCFQWLTVPLFYLTDLDFTQIVTLSSRQFAWFVCLAVTHWGRVTGFSPTTPPSSLMCTLARRAPQKQSLVRPVTSQ
ncbi:hypothetical protein PO909_029264 [Leuciscus waleckii]